MAWVDCSEPCCQRIVGAMLPDGCFADVELNVAHSCTVLFGMECKDMEQQCSKHIYKNAKKSPHTRFFMYHSL